MSTQPINGSVFPHDILPHFCNALLNWYQQNARDLPWRHTSDPYAIWVSEVMLQQTQVKTVIPYYERFLRLFPTVADLAAAAPADLAAAWAGLGYYSRVQRLQMAARVVVNAHDGIIPSSYAVFRQLPGVGDYTAGAVFSIAFHMGVPAVDGNVKRVLARILRIEESIDKPSVHNHIRAIAAALLLKEHQVGAFNQALMELGALICIPRRPRCGLCPVALWCKAKQTDSELQLPVRKPRKTPMRVIRIAGALWQGDSMLFTCRHEGPLQGFFELPSVELQDDEELSTGLQRLVSTLQNQGIYVSTGAEIACVQHKFSHQTWEVHIYQLKQLNAAATVAETLASYGETGLHTCITPNPTRPGVSWLSPVQLMKTGLPVALRKIVAAVLATHDGPAVI